MDSDILKFFGVMASLTVAGVFGYAGVVLVNALHQRLTRRRSPAIEPEELEALRAQVVEIDTVHARLEELEQRVDFAERLLIRGEGPAELTSPTPDPGR